MPYNGPPPSYGASIINLMILARDTPEELNDDLSGIPCLLLTNSQHYPSGLRAYIEYRVAELARNQG
ncbi:hypothetical protein GJ744_003057 [Endocarpon pusillum]|uniref:Uncharacterized protein n=1 Tax=Endocarpon pusillum TaxID=364733 RepID=A0A8H7E007_9EURO|nr:hypothetical protein GJ744_003057 [Endocarpon pusillum]